MLSGPPDKAITSLSLAYYVKGKQNEYGIHLTLFHQALKLKI